MFLTSELKIVESWMDAYPDLDELPIEDAMDSPETVI